MAYPASRPTPRQALFHAEWTGCFSWPGWSHRKRTKSLHRRAHANGARPPGQSGKFSKVDYAKPRKSGDPEKRGDVSDREAVASDELGLLEPLIEDGQRTAGALCEHFRPFGMLFDPAGEHRMHLVNIFDRRDVQQELRSPLPKFNLESFAFSAAEKPGLPLAVQVSADRQRLRN